jgi:hypothetical protein
MKKQAWVPIVVVTFIGVASGTFFFGVAPRDKPTVGAATSDSEPTDAIDASEGAPSELLEDQNKAIAQVGEYGFFFRRSVADIGGATPEVSNSYEARNTSTNKAVQASELFTESAIVAGFAEIIQSDAYAADAETKEVFHRLKSARSASELTRHLSALEASPSLKSSEGCDGEIFKFDPSTENFAIVGYDPASSKAVLHISVTGTSHLCDSAFPRLRIEVTAPPTLKSALAEALSGKKGFLPKAEDLKACDTCDPVDFNVVELSGP